MPGLKSVALVTIVQGIVCDQVIDVVAWHIIYYIIIMSNKVFFRANNGTKEVPTLLQFFLYEINLLYSLLLVNTCRIVLQLHFFVNKLLFSSGMIVDVPTYAYLK